MASGRLILAKTYSGHALVARSALALALLASLLSAVDAEQAPEVWEELGRSVPLEKNLKVCIPINAPRHSTQTCISKICVFFRTSVTGIFGNRDFACILVVENA